MKFFNLLKKELSELITAQTIISLVVIASMLMLMGNMMKTTISEAVKSEYTISISDRDNTEFTKQLAEVLKKSGAELNMFDTSGDDYSAILKETDQDSIIIIPEGFTDDLENGKQPQLISISAMESAAMMSNVKTDNSGAIALIQSCVANTFAEKSGLSPEQVKLMNEPTILTENTVVNGKTASIASTRIMSSLMTKNMILPIVVFVLIMFTSSMLISAISNEKIDKTLETLLSAPVSRTSILFAKMLAAAIIALMNAVVYMFGFSSFVGGATEEAKESLANSAITEFMSVDTALEKLGLTLSFGDYVLVGAQLFLTIMICLSIALMLGSLVNDTKQSQTMIMPLMIMAMIPYLISMFADINTLPTAFRIIVYAIPFTHTFSAMNNIMFGHMGAFYGGLAYQAVVFIICMTFALKLFTSDKILTTRLNFGQKSKYKKKSGENE